MEYWSDGSEREKPRIEDRRGKAKCRVQIAKGKMKEGRYEILQFVICNLS
jgi:hypothetical protein